MPNILVVDDDPATRAALHALLNQRKFGVCLAPDGPSGLLSIHNASFDAIERALGMSLEFSQPKPIASPEPAHSDQLRQAS